MRIEDQVTSLELAKRLKELGVRQESLFWWVDEGRYVPSWRVKFKKKAQVHWASRQEERFVSAFTVAELGELLPQRLFFEDGYFYGNVYFETYPLNTTSGWLCNYVATRGTVLINPYLEEAHTEADARAKMLIYLLENDLISLTDINGSGSSTVD
jgi:hypothetical protein